jgi:hypothetical protein
MSSLSLQKGGYMNREQAKKLLPVIQAFADGKDVQCRDKGCVGWADVDRPVWSYGMDYRIKPEPREWYMVLDHRGLLVEAYDTLQGANDRRDGGAGWEAIRVREVIG